MTEEVKRKYILVAEDDSFYQNLYKVKLTNEGFDVNVASNGKEAIDEVKKRKPDLVLLDLIMPDKDGFEVLREIRGDPQTKDLKVIVLSNLGQEEDIKKVKELGVLDYLIKTNVSIQSVVSKIKEHLSTG